MTVTSSTWLHENFEHTGSAFGLRIVRKLEEVLRSLAPAKKPTASRSAN